MERRKHVRFPVMQDLSLPIEIMVDKKQKLPAFLVDLSAIGMGLLIFIPININTKVRVVIDLPGLKTGIIEGIVKWFLPKNATWRIGVEFTHIHEKDFAKINEIAQDYSNCQYKISSGFKDVCHEDCKYWLLCEKPQKIKWEK